MDSQRTYPLSEPNSSATPLTPFDANANFIFPLAEEALLQLTSPIESRHYSDEEHETWHYLSEKHQYFAQSDQYLCLEYREGFKKLNFNPLKIQDLNTTSLRLHQLSGWKVACVKGFVSPDIFFKHFANKEFPCTDFIRPKAEIGFTATPDTFHDQIGHLPMMVNQRFADFLHFFGCIATKVDNPKQLEWFNRIYWFTVETGLINPTLKNGVSDPASSRIFGASIASSCEETLYSLSAEVKRYPFDIDMLVNTPFDYTVKQSHVFELSSFDELEHSFQAWIIKNKFI